MPTRPCFPWPTCCRNHAWLRYHALHRWLAGVPSRSVSGTGMVSPSARCSRMGICDWAWCSLMKAGGSVPHTACLVTLGRFGDAAGIWTFGNCTEKNYLAARIADLVIGQARKAQCASALNVCRLIRKQVCWPLVRGWQRRRWQPTCRRSWWQRRVHNACCQCTRHRKRRRLLASPADCYPPGWPLPRW